MSEPTQSVADAPAPEPASSPAPESATPAAAPSIRDNGAPITAREAAGLISEQSDTQSADKADAAPERPRGETDGSDPPVEPIEAPRSWNKAQKEQFATLPRDTQEYLVSLDRTRELEIRRVQNEAAAQRQAAEAMAQQAEQAQAQARQQYEQNLPQNALLLEAQYHEEFGTPTQEELKEWADTDPTKWIRWNNAFQRVTTARGELYQLQQQQYQQQQYQQQQFMQNAEAWKAEETRKLHAKQPEWADPKTYGEKVAEIMDYMQSGLEFTHEELSRFATEFVPLSIHDHRVQIAFWKSNLYDKAQKAARSPSRAPVPPVQRPGSAPNRGEANEARFRDLNRQLDRTGDARDAARLIAAMNGR